VDKLTLADIRNAVAKMQAHGVEPCEHNGEPCYIIPAVDGAHEHLAEHFELIDLPMHVEEVPGGVVQVGIGGRGYVVPCLPPSFGRTEGPADG
jgi:hypothetical protein